MSKDRPFKIHIVTLRMVEGDTLVETKLDCLARNTKEGTESLFERGVKVYILNVGLLERMGHFFIITLLVVDEMERNLIV
ncbi:recombinase family protein [Bacillus nitratireducens]|uniref:Recombinase family protein n=1 Tax=Bacillus nitratireducens TaxID=2026193 RepID=A0ABU6P707_9BACI|nr:recombinase family protein [Bacillus nitratireducens]